MNYYIRSAGNISPQKTFGKNLLTEEAVRYSGNRLHCIEPEYKEIIDVKLLRRMSRIIRMGVASAMECLNNAGIDQPDAIVTGTAYGCLEDTIVFLKKMVQNNEEMLSPAAFIQSTHNTVGAQIALMLKCNNYNNTFTSRGFSFENALVDAMMLLEEKDAGNVLVGGLDEITETSHAILNRFDLYKSNVVSSSALYQTKSKGTIAGEGSAYFIISGTHDDNSLAKLDGVRTFFKPADKTIVENNISAFLSEQHTSVDSIDLIIMGNNGDAESDSVYEHLEKNMFSNKRISYYKDLSGEYPTSSAFALWLGAQSVRNNFIPFRKSINNDLKINKVLIYNHYLNLHHSLILLSAC